MMSIFYDCNTRSIAKAVTWKILAFCITLTASYIFSGSMPQALKITGSAALIGIVMYYIHERIWNRIDWGRNNSAS
jgi:uncharacterized membrane protein